MDTPTGDSFGPSTGGTSITINTAGFRNLILEVYNNTAVGQTYTIMGMRAEQTLPFVFTYALNNPLPAFNHHLISFTRDQTGPVVVSLALGPAGIVNAFYLPDVLQVSLNAAGMYAQWSAVRY